MGIRNVIQSFSPLGSYFSLEANFIVTGRYRHAMSKMRLA